MLTRSALDCGASPGGGLLNCAFETSTYRLGVTHVISALARAGVAGARATSSVSTMAGPSARLTRTIVPCCCRTRAGTVSSVSSWDDVRRLALALPGTSEQTSRGLITWCVRDKLFVWERPLRASDLRALGDAAPSGPILGARVEHLGAKEALLESEPGVYFTTPHFDGYPAILVRLAEIGIEELDALVTDAWLARAPKRLGDEFVRARGHAT